MQKSDSTQICEDQLSAALRTEMLAVNKSMIAVQLTSGVFFNCMAVISANTITTALFCLGLLFSAAMSSISPHVQ